MKEERRKPMNTFNFNPNKFFCIAGPCVIEEQVDLLQLANQLKQITSQHSIDFIFKASFDKANRSSISSYRGPGLNKGIKILSEIKKKAGIPICTDVHETSQMETVSSVADIIQIPAFLCRQTDLIVEAAKTNKIVHIKKGQFLAPEDILPIIKKIRSVNDQPIIVGERGSSFGYHNLVVDMRSLIKMKEFDVTVILDGTHSTQLPGAAGDASGGEKKYAKYLCRAATACEVDGLFLEVHPSPAKALSDRETQLTPEEYETILSECKQIRSLIV